MVSHESFEIRRESPFSDLAADLLNRYFDELDRRFPDGFDPGDAVHGELHDYQSPNGVFLVAYSIDVPAGCAALRRFDDSAAEIKRMWIDPSARGRGIGRGLLSALESLARDLGYRRLCLDTSAHLHEAIALYRSSGFEQIADYNNNPEAALWFGKDIESTSAR